MVILADTRVLCNGFALNTRSGDASRIDHAAHGWALLALRMPAIRALAVDRGLIVELCESYGPPFSIFAN